MLLTYIMLSQYEENYEMNGARRTQEKFVHSRIQQSEDHAPFEYVGMGEGKN